MPDKRDYYEVLGVSKSSTTEDVKKAYRKLARKHHPDVNPGDGDAEDRFKEVVEAYEVLADPQRREMYDRFGHAAVNGPSGGPGPGDFGFNVDFGGLGDIFDMFFGAGQGQRARQKPASERGSDLRYDIELTLEDAAVGVEKTIRISRNEACGTCKGTGAAAGSKAETCQTCHGTGQVRQQQQTFLGTQIRVTTCPKCNGEGRTISHPCHECSGQARVRKTVERTISIPAGVDHGTRIRIPNEGDAGLRGGPTGDLYVITHIKPHSTFERRGNDIWCEIPVTFTQAALGAAIKVKTLTGEETLNMAEGTQSGEVYTLRGKGMPDVRGRMSGDLNVVIKVKTPTKLNDEQKELLRKLSEIRKESLDPVDEKGFFERVKDIFREI
jgi:molecular chaperone DnaJ